MQFAEICFGQKILLQIYANRTIVFLYIQLFFVRLTIFVVLPFNTTNIQLTIVKTLYCTRRYSDALLKKTQSLFELFIITVVFETTFYFNNTSFLAPSSKKVNVQNVKKKKKQNVKRSQLSWCNGLRDVKALGTTPAEGSNHPSSTEVWLFICNLECCKNWQKFNDGQIVKLYKENFGCPMCLKMVKCQKNIN